jgi:hypothetical protein
MKDRSGTRESKFELFGKTVPTATSLSELEAEIARNFRQAGREMLQRSLEALEESSPAPITRCRWCGKEARYVSNRPGFISTGYGQIRYRRAYYVCRHCCRSTCPLDERLKPNESLARLRKRLEAGQSLAVDELASAWGLGSLDCEPVENLALHSSTSAIVILDDSKALPVDHCCTST